MPDLPYQWAAAGEMGAIRTGKTICGTLFGGTVALGALYGRGAPHAPASQDPRRRQAQDAVQGLYREFIARFGHTECRTLTGCDWTKEEDIARYRQQGVFEDKCCKYLECVLSVCLQRIRESALPPTA
jgi:hypothetical protein